LENAADATGMTIKEGQELLREFYACT